MLRRGRLRLVAVALGAALLLSGCSRWATEEEGTDVETAPHGRVLDGQDLLSSGDPEGAALLFEELLREHPRSRLAMRGLPACERARLSPDAFRARWQAEVEAKPDDADVWYLYGRSQIEQPEAAAAAFSEAIELDPRHPWAVAGLAYLSYRRGDLFGAIQVYEEGVRKAPRSTRMRLLLANQYMELALFQHARRHLDVAIRLDADDVEVRAALGKTLAETGEEARAQELLEGVLEEEPRLAHAAPSLAAIYLDQDRPHDADALYRAALERGLPPRDELAAEIRAALVLAEIRAGR